MQASVHKQLANRVCAAAMGIVLLASPAWSRVHDLYDRGERYDRGDRYEHRDRDRSRTRVEIDIAIGRGEPDICLPPPPGPCDTVYEERIERVWVEPEYRTVYERVWREPVIREEIEQVWIEPVYEWRDVIRYDDCGNRIVIRQRVLVCPGRWEQRRRQVVVCEGRWETIQRQELVTPGHWDQRVVRVPVERPPVAIRFNYRRW
jgi:hypothetical protein